MKELSLIVAMDRNRGIGFKNDLPWGKLKADMTRVQKLTSGNTIIMGRKNYESIGKPLPDRRNIILTRNPNYVAEGCEVYTSVEEVMEAISTDTNEVFVFGGEEIYKLFFKYVVIVYMTEVQGIFTVDTFFPRYKIGFPDWDQVDYQYIDEDEKNPYDMIFTTYVKKA